MVQLRIQGVSCRYDSIQALSNVEFSVHSGELMGIVGPNGSGKTTLLKTVNRILQPAVGTILIDGMDICCMKPIDVARKIAVVPQDGLINVNLTALEIVLIGRNPYLDSLQTEGERDTEIAKEAMKITSCLHLANRRINELSGGEKRRVILARALAQEPRILLLDEPTMNLDVNSQIELMESVSRLCRERTVTVLSVFHDLNLAARYSDYILLLRQGRVFSLGTPEEALTVENLRSVFRVDAEVSKHQATRLVVTILSVLSEANENHTLEQPVMHAKN